MKRIGGRLNAWKGPHTEQKNNLSKKDSILKFSPTLLRHCGIPEAGDALAYDPIQRLLAVATADGRIKVFGEYGLEINFTSTESNPTKSLTFLPNAGALLRLAKDGPLELLNIDDRKISSTVEINGDQISCFSIIPGQPYIMLGCTSGVLRVCCLTDSNLEPTSQARPIRNLRLLNYRVSKHLLRAAGELTTLSVCLSPEGPLALLLHSVSGITIWNIRRSKPVCQLPHDSMEMLVSAKMPDPGPISCSCWVGKLTSPCLLATGHESGDILTWCLPDSLQGLDREDQMQFPRPIHRFLTRQDPSVGSRVHSLAFISGEVDGLLVFGGQTQEEPAGLNLIKFPTTVEEQEDSAGEKMVLPWFGSILDFQLVPPQGSMDNFDDPVGILVLTEFGNLILHDIKQGKTVPYSMPFQTYHQQSSISFFTTLSPSSPLLSLSTDLMLDMGGILDLDYLWVVAGGTREARKEEKGVYGVLLVGYQDSSIRFWDFTNSSPYCFLQLGPSGSFQAASISSLLLLDDGKLLIVGDERGQVFIFHFSLTARVVDTRFFTSPTNSCEITSSEQPAGFQLLISLTLHEASIHRFNFDSRSSQLGILDSKGLASLLNLTTLDLVLVSGVNSGSPIVDLVFCEVGENTGQSLGLVLFLLEEDSGLLAVDIKTGTPLHNAEWFKPRNLSKSLALYSLDDHGLPVEKQDLALPQSDAFFWTVGQDLSAEQQDPIQEEEEKEQEDLRTHSRLLSDDVETGVLLAAAVAKLAEEKDSTPRSGQLNSLFLVITETYVRLYSPHSVLASVRAPLHKISFTSTIVWSTVFSMMIPETSVEEAGLILLTEDGVIHLVALPSLDILGASLLRDIFTFPASNADQEVFLKPDILQGDGRGGVYVCGRNGESMWFEVVSRSEQDFQKPAKFQLYDWELAAAANSASHAQLSQLDAPQEEMSSPSVTLKKGMNFFVSLGRRARDELDKAMRLPTTPTSLQGEEQEKNELEPPELEVLFCVADRGPPPEIRPESSLPTDVSFQDPVRVSRSVKKFQSFDLTERLPYPPASARQRTAEEVRAKYGRPRASYQSADVSNEVGAIMAENVSKLHERGEKLKTLNDKTEDLMNDAQSFAQMAKSLAQQKSKKWWQF